MKVCSMCHIEKPYDSFGISSCRDDGLQSYCIDCMRIYASGRRLSGGWGRWRERRCAM